MSNLGVSFIGSFDLEFIPISIIMDELLKLRKISTPDVLGFNGSILSIAAHVIAPSLQVLFCKSLELGYVPGPIDWSHCPNVGQASTTESRPSAFRNGLFFLYFDKFVSFSHLKSRLLTTDH